MSDAHRCRASPVRYPLVLSWWHMTISVSLDTTSHTEVVPPDPEGIAFGARRQRLYWSSEGAFEPARTGEPAIMLNPWVRIAGLDGSYLGEFTMPPGSNMSAAGDAGPRPNQSLEGLTLSPNGRFLFAAMEDPRYEDGPNPDHDHAALVRITQSTSSREPLSPNMLTR